MGKFKFRTGKLVSNKLSYLGVIAWYSLLATWFLNEFFALSPDIDLSQLGVATLENQDITLRVREFYQQVFLLLASGSVFLFIGYLLQGFWSLCKNELRLLNQTAWAGVLLVVFYLLGSNVHTTMYLLLSVHAVLWVVMIVRTFYPKPSLEPSQYLTSFAIAFGLSWLITWALILGKSYAGDLDFIVSFTGLSLLIILIQFGKVAGDRLHYSLAPWIGAPILMVLSEEIYLILHSQSIYFLYPLSLFAIGLVVFVGLSIFRWRNFAQQPPNVQGLYLPLLIAALVGFHYYQVLVPTSYEMFEEANPALAVQQYVDFGRLPILETFNSHLASEFVFEILYVMFHGMEGLAFKAYYFLYQIPIALAVYFFLRKVFSDGWFAFSVVLFFPIINLVLPPYYALVLFHVLVVVAYLKNPNLWRGAGLALSVFFFILWRIDLGYGVLIATGVMLAAHVMQGGLKQIKPIQLLSGTGLVALAILVNLGVILLIKPFDVIGHAREALMYFSSGQSYGYLQLTRVENVAFEVQFYIVPMLLVLLALIGFLRIMQGKYSLKHYAVAGMVFLIVFHLANMQRGLIRHNFYEHTDRMVIAMGWAILALAGAFLFVRGKQATLRKWLFVVLGVVLVYGFKYPELGWADSYYFYAFNKVEGYQPVKPTREAIPRYVEPPGYAEKVYGEVKTLMDQFPDHHTFLDFSNQPMLYFYLRRENPCYFNQNILSLHSRELQERFVHEVEPILERIPLVVFSRVPYDFWDQVDYVPNTIRHGVLARFIYEHYEPYTIANNWSIWKRKDEEMPARNAHTYSVADILKLKMNKKYLVRTNEKVNYRNILPDGYFGDSIFTIYTVDSSYFFFNNQRLKVDQIITDSTQPLLVTEADWIPDFFSHLPKATDLRKLPDLRATHQHYETLIEFNQDTSGNWIPNDLLPMGTDLVIEVTKPLDKACTIRYFYRGAMKGQFSFLEGVPNRSFTYLLDASSQWHWYTGQVDSLVIEGAEVSSVAATRSIYDEP